MVSWNKKLASIALLGLVALPTFANQAVKRKKATVTFASSEFCDPSELLEVGEEEKPLDDSSIKERSARINPHGTPATQFRCSRDGKIIGVRREKDIKKRSLLPEDPVVLENTLPMVDNGFPETTGVAQNPIPERPLSDTDDTIEARSYKIPAPPSETTDQKTIVGIRRVNPILGVKRNKPSSSSPNLAGVPGAGRPNDRETRVPARRNDDRPVKTPKKSERRSENAPPLLTVEHPILESNGEMPSIPTPNTLTPEKPSTDFATNDLAATITPVPAPITEPTRRITPDVRPSGNEVAVILTQNQFFPAHIVLKEGSPVRLLFTSVNRKPAALVIEKLQVQKWLNREEASEQNKRSRNDPFETYREVNSQKITEVFLEPKHGTYAFYDAISGAFGEILVE